MLTADRTYGWAGATFPGKNTRSEKPEKNYGADFNTLIELLEAGKL
jgi:hypothetical protein